MKYNKIDEIRFWSKVKVGKGTEGCWYWNGSKHKFGYGWFRINKKTYLSHRLALIFWDKKEKRGLQVNHKCNNPACCNPKHLYWGTQKENIKDCILAGNKVDPPRNGKNPPIRRGEDNHMSIMTKEKVFSLREDRAAGMTHKDLGKKYGISTSTACQISNYKSWKYL